MVVVGDGNDVVVAKKCNYDNNNFTSNSYYLVYFGSKHTNEA